VQNTLGANDLEQSGHASARARASGRRREPPSPLRTDDGRPPWRLCSVTTYGYALYGEDRYEICEPSQPYRDSYAVILILDRYRCIRHVGQLHTAVELETSREPDDTRRQNCMTLIANWWMGAVRSENCRLNLRRLSQNALVRARGGRSARSHSAARPSCHGVSARPSVQHATRARQASDGFLLSW
jgi:hypothetical protein